MKQDTIKNELLSIGVPSEFIPIIIELGSLKKVKNKEIVLEINSVCENLFIVLNGGFVSQQLDSNGHYKTINFFLRNLEPYMTSFNSFFKGGQSDVQLKAIKKSTVLVLNKNEIERLKSKNYKFKDYYIERLIHALLLENKFKSFLITKSPEETYNILKQDYSILFSELSLSNIAEFMGISRVWLSNIKNKLVIK